jgi:hypothetical protein
MIPGGFKGLRFLHKLGVTTKVNVSLEEREQAISEFIRQNPTLIRAFTSLNEAI